MHAFPNPYLPLSSVVTHRAEQVVSELGLALLLCLQYWREINTSALVYFCTEFLEGVFFLIITFFLIEEK